MRRLLVILPFYTAIVVWTGCGQSSPQIATQPQSHTIVVGQTATFSVIAGGGSSLTCQWMKNSTPIPGATLGVYTTPPATASDSGAQYSAVLKNSGGSVTSATATLTVVPSTDVLTYHNDLARTGQNSTESILTLANVNVNQFGRLGLYRTDGFVDAQPLYVSNVTIPNLGAHNLLIVATENASVYAFDADTGVSLWKTSLLTQNETASNDPSYPTGPQIGANATPVIDRKMGAHGAIYVEASSKDNTGNYHQRLHALDLVLGTEMLNGPTEIEAKFPGTGDNSDGTNVIFDPMQYRERASLLLSNGVVYTTWASHYDVRPYTGWIIGYSEFTLAQVNVFNVTPNGNDGAIWMSGAGPAADSAGNIYFLDANGSFDDTMDANGFPSQGDYGNAFIKLSTTGNQLAVADYFVMEFTAAESLQDLDLGSGGALLLPDMSDGAGHTLHLAVGAGKDMDIYVVNRDSMGKMSANDANVYQELPNALPGGIWSAPAYFNNTIFYGPRNGQIEAFEITNGKLAASASFQSANSFGTPGATPTVSANGTTNGIVWAAESVPGKWPNQPPAPFALGLGVLHAYDASNLHEIYNSNQAPNYADQIPISKFVAPMIANGKVFVGTPIGVAVFGLRQQ